MFRRLLGRIFVFVGLFGSIAQASSHGTQATEALATAERALQSVDYETVHAAASAGLTTGKASPGETARLHVLAGISAAVLGKDDVAKQHFVVALAIRPDLKLDESLSPRTRQPYLEATGYWGDRKERLQITASADARRKRLAIHIVDAATIAPGLRVHLRATGEMTFQRTTFQSRARVEVPLTTRSYDAGFEYYLELVDASGNRLFELGTEDEPIVVEATHKDAKESGARLLLQPKSPAVEPSRAFPIVMLAGGLVVTGAGVYFNVRREDEAARWNSPDCERSGETRNEACGDVDRRRERFEWLAIGSYALGGALTIAGASWLLLDWHSAGRPTQVGASVTCGIAGTASFVSCRGMF